MLRLLRTVLILSLLLPLGGCYYLHLASGETRLLMRREPIRKVIDAPTTDPALKARLTLALRARAFASDRLDLPRNRSYTLYADIGRPFVMYNVFATPPLSMRPITHCFPIAGCVAYRGYYDKTRAEAEARRMRAKGDDVYIGGVPAYSTLGHFADPVLSSMNRWSDDELVGTIFHELAHQKLYLKGDTAFNEAYATFVQREGLREWHAAEHLAPSDPGAAQRSVRFTQLVLATRERLSALYASDRSDAEKLRLKQAAFADLRAQYRALREGPWRDHDDYDAWMAQPLNNATLLPFALYDRDVPAFAALFAQVHRSWPAFFQAVRRLSVLPAKARHARLAALRTSETTEPTQSSP
ncbi:aminopeptidase [Oleiagrimonas soli]|uniref:Aminopeptidase n=1 Tax=Oleiagrimonas soli TaxID=1543381 RepID=A0A099CTA7_9GAMM|nr:aminopeptidase [Oleiagrimonas soli]KGI76911.1 aminopeptidase [Oleiagrimonas soli]MBB6185230.1 putative aminopeptidase [Oleiagrimonas soli]